MSSAARLSRLLALVPWLVVNDGITITEAATHFGVSPEQLEKDLWLLIVCGLPGHGPDQLVDIQFWEEARIHVLDAQTMSAPLRLSGDEVVALLVGLRLLAQIPGDHDRAALLRATHRLQDAVGDLGGSCTVVVDVSGDASVIDVLNEAIIGNRHVHIVYGSATRDEVTERDIEPLRITSDDGRTYVEAMCRRAGAVRTFRLDRILKATLPDRHSEVDIADDPQQTTSIERHGTGDGGPRDAGLAVSAITPPSFSARIKVDGDARWVLDVLALDDIEDAADGSISATVLVHDPEWLVHTMLSLGGIAEVTTPETLRKAVAHAAERALTAYAEDA